MPSLLAKTVRAIVGGLAIMLLVIGCGPVVGLLPAPSPTPSGVLRVQVMERFFPGVAQPISRTSPPTPVAHPVRISFHVRIALAGSSGQVVAEGDTNASGMIEFHVPPGQYWAFLPKNDQPNVPPGYVGALGNATMPDQTTVFGWSDVTVPRKGQGVAQPTIEYAGA